MTVLQVSETLAEAIRYEAETRDQSIEEFLAIVLRRERTLADRRKIEDEQDWWLSLPLSERATYGGQFVAVHNRRLIDHDRDELALRHRVRNKYQRTAVLLMPAEGPREIRIISPRLEREGTHRRHRNL
jgi:hypothetical protein